MYSLPFLVMSAFVECGMICGTFAFSVTGTIGKVTELQLDPIITCTLS